MRLGTIHIRPERIGGQLTGKRIIELESHLGAGETVTLRLGEEKDAAIVRAEFIAEALNWGLPSGLLYVVEEEP